MKRLALLVILVAAAAAIGWYAGSRSGTSGANESGSSGVRKVAYYQSAMHPWIKSDQPGNCTICGMKLTPVYEGEQGVETTAGMITLSETAINVIHVQTETAAPQPLEGVIEVAGRIEPDERRLRVISAYLDARVEQLFVNFVGAAVRPGEPLAILYSPALLTAEREYLTALSQTNLFSSSLAGEHRKLVESARQRLKRLGLAEEQIDAIPSSGGTNLASQILAPIGGTVLARSVFEGQYVKEGDKLFEIADLSRLWFRFEVYERDLPQIRTGQTVEISAPAFGSRTIEGQVAFVEPTINNETRSARVRVEIENGPELALGAEGPGLLNGLFAVGRIRWRSEPVLVVSRAAVLDPGDHPRVYVDQGGGAYEHRRVKVGRRGENGVEILAGLEAGEKVVSQGNLLLDSQAQIDQSSSGDHQAAPSAGASAESPAGTAVPSEALALPLTDQQRVAALAFFESLHQLGQALASDNLAEFEQHLPRARARHAALHQEFSAGRLHALVEKSSLAETGTGADLNGVRLAFRAVGSGASELARALRGAEPDWPTKIYRCPMYPKSGQSSFWVQTEGPLRNPFYGAEMLECGQEVR